MYKLETYIKEDRIPYMVKTEICNEKITVNTPKKVFNMLNTYFNLGLRSEEYVYMISMDAKCNIIGIFEISHGIINQSMLNPREIFMKALLSGAASIILAHNHPSGNCSPSQEDRNCCRRIHETGEILGVELADFLIISEKHTVLLKKKHICEVSDMKVLVTVTETYTHTYCVEAESKEDAIRYAEDKGLDCDVFSDYDDTEYEARLPEGEDLSLYEFVKD